MNSEISRHPPIIGFVAYSGTGKTTLLKSIISLLAQMSFKVGAIKHTHHDFEIDLPGKDSYELRKAGAQQTLIASPHRWAMIEDLSNNPLAPLSLGTLIDKLDTSKLDLILVEGFKNESFPKIELWRKATARPFLFPQDPTIVAIACDTLIEFESGQRAITQLDLNDPQTILKFVLKLAAIKP